MISESMIVHLSACYKLRLSDTKVLTPLTIKWMVFNAAMCRIVWRRVSTLYVCEHPVPYVLLKGALRADMVHDTDAGELRNRAVTTMTRFAHVSRLQRPLSRKDIRTSGGQVYNAIGPNSTTN